MSLLSPMMLYLFGLAGVIIAVYFLKRKVNLLPVSALFLWQKAAEKPKSALRFLWSNLFLLFLQLLALALLVGALANPVFYTQAAGPKRLALIIDGSLSMQAKTNKQKTRYDEAVAKAIEIINQNPTAQIMVVQAQAQSVILSPLSRNKAEILNTLRRSRPTFQGDATFRGLLGLLKSQAPLGSFDKIVFLTDHTPPRLELWEDLGVELVLIGDPFDPAAVRNVGITSFAVRRQPRQFASLQVNKLTSSKYSVLVTLENFSKEKTSPHLKISADGEIISEADIVIEAETRESYEFSYSGPAHLFKAEIALEDDLEADNVRYFALPHSPKVRSLWLGEENPHLRSALSVLGGFAFERSENLAQAPMGSAPPPDLIVANSVRFTQPVEGNLFLINSELLDVIEFIDDKKEPTEWRVKAADHPVLKGLDTGEFFAAPFQKAKVSERGQIVVSAETDSAEHPLLYLYQDERLRLVWLGLDLRYANLVLSLDFPILIKNIISWLLPSLFSETNLEIGDGISLVGLPRETQMIHPQGRIATLLDQTAFLNTDLPGFYKLVAEDRVLTYAVNPPAAESDVRPRGQSQIPSRKVESPTSYDLRLSDLRLFRPFVVGGLILLLLELYLYNPSLLRLKGDRR